LSHNIVKDWERGSKEPLFTRIAEKIRPGAPLKERVAMSIYRLKVQQNRLEGASMRMQQHDRELFNKCIAAQMAKDSARAAMYANECAEVRKMAKITLRCQLALEQAALRLETVQEFGDIAVMMGPVAGVVRAIKSQVAGVMPEVSYELGEIGETLNGMVLEVGEATGQTYGVETSNEEAQRILNEANAIAEQRMKERFPELPSTALPTPEKTSETSMQR